MQKRAVLSGRLSFVHTVYPILKVHSTDFFSNIFFFQRPLTRGEEIPQSALFVRVIKQLSTANTILRLVAQHLLLQMHSMSITPECYSGILVKNTPSFRKELGVGYICRFLRFSFSFTSLIPSPILPRDEREKTERTTAQLPANKKCCLLIFSIAIGCLVLAAIPARNPRLSFSIISNYSGHLCVPATCCVFASGLANNLVPILSSRSPSSLLLCSAGSPITLVAFWGALCGSAREKSPIH